LVEAAGFAIASLVHSGLLMRGYEHARARTAEGLIALVLILGVVLSLLQPQSIRRIGAVTQGFALLGTLVGLVTVAVGIGPQTTADIIFHIGIICVLAWGLRVARAGAEPR
jgi:hypothetical protein